MFGQLCYFSLAFTLHTSSVDYNSIHPAFNCETNDYQFNVYYNSLNKTSLSVNKKFYYNDFYLQAGLVTGHVYDVLPMARVGVETDYGDYFALPLVEDNELTGIVLGVEVKIK